MVVVLYLITNIYDDLNYDDHSRYDNQCLVTTDSHNYVTGSSILNKMLAKLHDTCYMLGDHNDSSDCIYNVGDDEIVRTISLTFLNQRVFHNGQWVEIVHIQDQKWRSGAIIFYTRQ